MASNQTEHPYLSLDSAATWTSKKAIIVIASLAIVGCVATAVAYTAIDLTSAPGAQSQSQVRIPDEYISGQEFLDQQSGIVDLPKFYKNSACPFAKWFSRVHANTASWEENLVGAYETAWADTCNSGSCAEGFDENDHNYKTLLGQGNTLGFVAGHLDIDLQDVPSQLQSGLFANEARYPLIARFSDFGADNSALRLARLALKMPFPTSTGQQQCSDGSVLEGGSWAGEINFLFTESMDAFPLGNYNDLSDFAKDPSGTTWDSIKTKFHAVQVFIQSGLQVLAARNLGLLEKEYYSQVPYRLGCDFAMKFRVVPVEQCTFADAKFAAGVTDHLSQCDALFELQIQVKSLNNDWEVINRQAYSRWSEPYITVGTIVLPKQKIGNPYVAASDLLSSTLTDKFQLTPELSDGVHKLLAFHPLMTAEEHRPLGEINTFRSHFYSRHATSRFSTILGPIVDRAPEPIPGKPDYMVFAGQTTEQWMAPLADLFGQ